MSSHLLEQRKSVHRKAVYRVAETIGNACMYVLIFAALKTAFNWRAYSLIVQDWFSGAPASLLEAQQQFTQLSAELEKAAPLVEDDFSLTELGQLYPNEMRLKIPKLFGVETIPISEVQIDNFDFSKLYDSENKIQEALRDGVVHYPYTADPGKFGNVFITGHSSYYPWAKGTYKEVFVLLHKLEVGDEYSIIFRGQEYRYVVREKFEIAPNDISVLEQPVDKKLSTLMTCTPVGTTQRRLIVRAEEVKWRP
ncbi:MAG: sortase [bacterium]|nr:sortase [bacterium]